MAQLHRVQARGHGELEPTFVQAVGIAIIVPIDVQSTTKCPDDNV